MFPINPANPGESVWRGGSVHGWSWGAVPSGGYSLANYNWSGNVWDDETEVLPEGRQVFQHDAYDALIARRHMTPLTQLGQKIADAKKAAPAIAEDLGRDFFWALHKHHLRKHDDQLLDSHTINEELIDLALQTPEFQELRATTMGDAWLAEQAASKLIGPIISSLDSETLDRVNRLASLQSELDTIQARADALADIPGHEVNQLLAQAQTDAEANLAELNRQIAEARGQISEDEQAKIQGQLAAGAGHANQQLQQILGGMQALGGQLGGNNQALAYAQGITSGLGSNKLSNAKKAALALKLLNDQKLKMIAEMAGRMADVAFEIQNQKTELPTDELTDTRQGQDLQHMVGGELTYLSDPDLELAFLARFAQHQIMSYEIIGYTPQGRGPLVVMIDNSGSMSGDPEAWSKAVMCALRMIAQKQHRDMVVIHFDSTVKRVDEFPKGEADLEKMLANIEFFSGGGTNFEPPMREAMKWMNQSRYNRADAIFVTDGLCAIDDSECQAWNDLRKKTGMQSYCILIGDDRWGRGVMEKLTDKLMVVRPQDLGEHESVNSTILQTVFGV